MQIYPNLDIKTCHNYEIFINIDGNVHHVIIFMVDIQSLKIGKNYQCGNCLAVDSIEYLGIFKKIVS